MTKVVYESIVIIFTASFIFACTLSTVLLVLLWHEDTILGLNTNFAILIGILSVIIFSFGLVGTIVESFKALIIYACLLVIFPFGVLLIKLSLRLSVKSWGAIDQLLVMALIILFMQIIVAFLLARDIRRLSILNKGINYKVCNAEDISQSIGGSEIHLVNNLE